MRFLQATLYAGAYNGFSTTLLVCGRRQLRWIWTPSYCVQIVPWVCGAGRFASRSTARSFVVVSGAVISWSEATQKAAALLLHSVEAWAASREQRCGIPPTEMSCGVLLSALVVACPCGSALAVACEWTTDNFHFTEQLMVPVQLLVQCASRLTGRVAAASSSLFISMSLHSGLDAGAVW
jgi:hypothetical protein